MTLEARNLTFRYPRRGSAPVLERVNFSLSAGERVGLSAPSGQGKTTLCKLLAGWEEPSGGQVLLDGLPLARYRGFCPVQLLWQHPEEAVDPLRVLTSLMRIEGREKPFSVKTSGPIPKRLLFDCTREIMAHKAKLPVHVGDVILHDVCGTGRDIISTQEVLT